MKEFRIFTESKADIKFLRDYIEEIFEENLGDNYFDPLFSWSGYKAGGNVKEAIRENHDNERITILILDGDGDIEQRREEVINDFKGYGIPVMLFLFPNDSANGCLENLLSEIAVHRNLIECFEGYEQCINGYNVPVIKGRIYAYLEALLPEQARRNNAIKEENRNYRIQEYWNLNHNFLEPLKQFLSPFLLDSDE